MPELPAVLALHVSCSTEHVVVKQVLICGMRDDCTSATLNVSGVECQALKDIAGGLFCTI